jgi:hypothetical protein
MQMQQQQQQQVNPVKLAVMLAGGCEDDANVAGCNLALLQ